ncbi:MAG TPA: heme-binding protein [Pseudonocardia sp.]
MDAEHIANKASLSLAGAAAAVDAALAEATAMGVPITVVVVDESGNPKSMSRMDHAPLVSVTTATNKAFAAVTIGMPPDDFFEAIKEDAAAVASFATRPGLALIAGGLPVVVDGAPVGAIGVAGAMTGAEDRRIAEHAAAAINTART